MVQLYVAFAPLFDVVAAFVESATSHLIWMDLDCGCLVVCRVGSFVFGLHMLCIRHTTVATSDMRHPPNWVVLWQCMVSIMTS